jgi:hypothetical protein
MHGSVLLAASPAAPELPGIAEISGRALSREALAAAWLARLCPALDLVMTPGELSDGEQAEARRLCETKYAAAAWNERR